jgi:hypothetical protein
VQRTKSTATTTTKTTTNQSENRKSFIFNELFVLEKLRKKAKSRVPDSEFIGPSICMSSHFLPRSLR